MCSIVEHMKTATVRDLRNRYTELLAWLAAGQEVLITQRGKPVARLLPARTSQAGTVDWTKSRAVRRDRSQMRQLGADEASELIKESAGRW